MKGSLVLFEFGENGVEEHPLLKKLLQLSLFLKEQEEITSQMLLLNRHSSKVCF